MAGMMKPFLSSDAGGVLAGPLVQLAAGGKPSLSGLADPADLFHNKSTPGQPAVTATQTPLAGPSRDTLSLTSTTAAAQQKQLSAQAATGSGLSPLGVNSPASTVLG